MRRPVPLPEASLLSSALFWSLLLIACGIVSVIGVLNPAARAEMAARTWWPRGPGRVTPHGPAGRSEA